MICTYTKKEDVKTNDVMRCIKEAKVFSMEVGQGRRYRDALPKPEYYFKTQREMNAIFCDLPEALENTHLLLDSCEAYKLQREVLLPQYQIPAEFKNQSAYLKHITYEGAKKKYDVINDELAKRIEHELSIIEQMGFPGYFLIVQDLINSAKDMGVVVGPGRGSAAGSIVAYCVGITNIDPIKYSLLFERFLNPERISMPDIDIDFDDKGRQKVIDYVIQKYGKDRVAQIINYSTLKPKVSIKDVARVLELPLLQASQLAKLIPDKPDIDFKKAFEEVSDLQKLKHSHKDEAEVLINAEKIEGAIRGTSVHAAGVIIAPDTITDYVPVCTAKDSDLVVTQFDGAVIEQAGMLKMDFLALKTLTIIQDTLQIIKETQGTEIDIDCIPLDDEKTFKLYQRGDTAGTFQFESEGMRKYLQELKPTNIEDLIAMNALYRPGPMDFNPKLYKPQTW